MKIIISLVIATVLLSCTGKYNDVKNTENDYLVIPKPQNLTIEKGRFWLKKSTKINADVSLINEATYFAEIINNATGFNLNVEAGDSNVGDIQFVLDASIKNKEGYKIAIDPSKIIVSGANSTGVFYGIQTLKQLLPTNIVVKNSFIERDLTIPAGLIEDSPRYVYRGMHLDVGRHYFPMEFIKKYIDILSMHKMNTFHWHLTEDQGWRIEIKKYPKLTEIGAFRKETLIGHGSTSKKERVYDGIPYGGFYTQDEIKEVVAYAVSKHVTVIPEIEMPGHSLAAIASYPNLGNTGEQYEVGTRWGIFDEIYAPTDEVFNFLEDVLTEVMELFPSKYIHIGGDEAPKKQWEESSVAQEIIKREGLKDTHELQSYFIKRIEAFLNANGRNIIGWDEILEGGLAPNATVMSWRGTAGGIAAAKQHHSVIMTPGHSCYFDHYQVEDRSNEPLAIGGLTTVEDVYNYEPTPEELTKEQQQYILGAQGNVWTEYMTTTDYVEYMVLPRLTALSEVVWTSKSQKDYNDFLVRLDTMKLRYEALGINYAPHVFENE